ncbi:MAG: hypothetical protein ACRDYC_06130 [Acidimicrobiales bacterium]
MSIRRTVRVIGVAKNTITKLLHELDQACSEYEHGGLTNLESRRVECEEIWSFVGCKQKRVTEDHPDDVRAWTAIDANSKPVP